MEFVENECCVCKMYLNVVFDPQMYVCMSSIYLNNEMSYVDYSHFLWKVLYNIKIHVLHNYLKQKRLVLKFYENCQFFMNYFQICKWSRTQQFLYRVASLNGRQRQWRQWTVYSKKVCNKKFPINFIIIICCRNKLAFAYEIYKY